MEQGLLVIATIHGSSGNGNGSSNDTTTSSMQGYVVALCPTHAALGQVQARLALVAAHLKNEAAQLLPLPASSSSSPPDTATSSDGGATPAMVVGDGVHGAG